MSFNNAKELSIQSNFLRTKKMLIENNKVPPNFKDKVNEEYSFFWISDCQTEEVLKIRNNKNVIKKQQFLAMRISRLILVFNKDCSQVIIDFLGLTMGFSNRMKWNFEVL